MSEERLDLLNEYVKAGEFPMLIKNASPNAFNNSVVINSDIAKSELNGHYEGITFCPPMWYKELIEKSKNNYCILVIGNINEISMEEQTKFVEILKYKKISTFDLPKNCLIIATCTDLSKNKINEEVYSLLVEI